MKKHILNDRTKGLISIIFVMLIWGSSFTVTKVVLKEVPPFLCAALRHITASLILLPFYWHRRRQVQQQLPYKQLFLMGLAGVAVYYTFFNFGMSYIHASTGALIEGLIPVAIAIPAAIFLREPLRRKSVYGILLSVTGVILVGFVGADHKTDHALLGSLLLVGAVCCWSAYTLLSRQLKNTDTLLMTTMGIFLGTLVLIPVSGIEMYYKGIPHISPKAWAGIAYLGVFASAVAYFLYNRALESLPAAQVGNFLNLNPVIGALIAYIFLREQFTTLQLVGSVLVLAGILLSTSKVKTPTSQPV
ncbi:DMT family transporter [Chitinophaga nivalis]|uniref:DMT family transporter n=1 Tax=Chitinophaga nivalis TaxID=2991709 RepID=A0ABT3IQ61_9BACT|nr:DMT family transporter [Chitinophaga nivalis]MCW3464218.1 DMT family transporter [Chitinophaga nivalis]MCW3486092.1 DMT family transporter [Chitinophaga nivalis]